MDKKLMSDAQLDALLNGTKQPTLPRGFADRLQAKLEQPAPNNVIAFPQKKSQPAPSRRMWLSAIPLAASLAIGIYLGAQGTLADSISTLDTSLVSDATDSLFNIGIEDTESFLNGESS
jgi:hypothetical protein